MTNLDMQDSLLGDELIPEHQEFYTRVADRVNSGSILADLPRWITKNTSLMGRPWSFKDHEFQIEIAKDQRPYKCVKKCSQVGLTELQARLALAYVRVTNGRSLMYVLPYKNLAVKISKSRFDPVIEGSPSLSKAVTTGSNSADYKRFGNSNLYITGADAIQSAISAPIDRMIVDERDFCKERILSVLNSRMRHSDNPARDDFSTPTIGNFGITAAYEKSDQKRYLVKCLHCNQEQACDFVTQVVIPGFDLPFKDLTREDFTYHRYDFAGSYLRCIRCGKELDTAMMMASRRRWVAKHPGREVSGYAVKPFDLYKYNSTPKVILQYAEYSMQQDYWNFVLGEELDTKENKIDSKVVDECFNGNVAFSADDCYVGIDVGKTLHVFIGKRGLGKIDIFRIEQISINNGKFDEQVIKLLEPFNFRRLVIDAGPDISLPKALISHYGPERVLACTYTKGKAGSLKFYNDPDLEEGTISVARTKGFDQFVKTVNASGFTFPKCDLQKTVTEQFQQIARKLEYNDLGEKVATWVKLNDNDHSFHACFYAFVGMEIDAESYRAVDEVAPTSIVGVTMGKSHSSTIDMSHDIRNALAMHGFSRRSR